MLQGGLKNRRKFFDEEDANPMEGAINIVDAMLVFACGLMLSLVIFWNVDIQNKELVPVEKGAEITEVNNMTEEVKETVEEEAQYEKMGTVYVDPATGKMYLVQDGETTGIPLEQDGDAAPAPTPTPEAPATSTPTPEPPAGE